MSELRLGTWEMPAGGVGQADPLPRMQRIHGPHKKQEPSTAVQKKMRKLFQYGAVPGCLPYRVQYGYDRVLKPRTFRTAVLENDILRATFLTELGGRLWSLVHKPSDTELLYVNRVFQPANLGILNIWFSGGVEWNHGIRGHTPFTCEPLFVARVAGDDGAPVLRMYEWERIRRAPFQIDFLLPDGSPFLLARVRLTNPHDHEVPMYWWSNIAVDEAEGARIVVPAHSAYKFSYDGGIRQLPIPVHEGIDRTYPANPSPAGDYFYAIDDHPRPWIASLGPDGRGLVHVSTPRMRGRKMFRWGMGPGGRRWQEFLSPPGDKPYIEVQAGLARTQAECTPMPAGAEWTWLEAYGLMEADPATIHGEDWDAAIAEVEGRLADMLPSTYLEDTLAAAAAAADREPAELIQRGAGWGALERRRRERNGEEPFCSGALVFGDETLGAEQAPWLALLEEGELPTDDPADPPVSWMVQPEWRQLLEEAVGEGRGAHWLSWLHLGVMAYYAGEADKARKAWEKSIQMAPSAWAYRNLGLFAIGQDRSADAADFYLKARHMAPRLQPLAVECFKVLIRAERYPEAVDLVDELPERVRKMPRIQVLEARAALEIDDLDRVRRLLESDIVVTDMREGEVSLSDLWYRMHEKRLAAAENISIDDELKERVRREFPPPKRLDFRMHAHRSKLDAPSAAKRTGVPGKRAAGGDGQGS